VTHSSVKTIYFISVYAFVYMGACGFFIIFDDDS